MAVEGGDIKALKIQLLFFGPLADSLGHRNIEVVLEEGATVLHLIHRFQLLDALNSGLKIAINGEICENINILLSDSSEVAFLPPFSGG